MCSRIEIDTFWGGEIEARIRALRDPFNLASSEDTFWKTHEDTFSFEDNFGSHF